MSSHAYRYLELKEMQIRTLQINKRTSTTVFAKVCIFIYHRTTRGAKHRELEKWRFSSEQCVIVTRPIISDANNNRWPTADQLIFFVMPWVNFVLPWVKFVVPWLFVLPWQLWATVELSMEICACAFGLDHPVTLHDVSFVPQTGRACGCKLQKCYQSIMGNSC